MSTSIIDALKQNYLSEEKIGAREVTKIISHQEMKNNLKNSPNANVFLVFRNNNDLRRNLCIGIEAESIIYYMEGADLWAFFPELRQVVLNHNQTPFYAVKALGEKLAGFIERSLTLVYFQGAPVQPLDQVDFYTFDLI